MHKKRFQHSLNHNLAVFSLFVDQGIISFLKLLTITLNLVLDFINTKAYERIHSIENKNNGEYYLVYGSAHGLLN